MAFFEQIGKRLTDAGQNVAQQTKNFAEIAQLNSAISEKERKIAELFSGIGQSYYEKHKSDTFAEEAEKCAQITALYAEIFQDREKIKQIKGVAKCPSCGADVPAGAAFCNSCGCKMEQQVPAQETAAPARLCQMCHTPVGTEDVFCPNCGAKLG